MQQVQWRKKHGSKDVTERPSLKRGEQSSEGRLNLNFQAHPYGVAFFESLKHAKISYKNIEFKN